LPELHGECQWGTASLRNDSDGDPDVLLCSWTGSTALSEVYRSGGGTFADANAGLTGVNDAGWGAGAAWELARLVCEGTTAQSSGAMASTAGMKSCSYRASRSSLADTIMTR
jgi:hypothetical protein